MDSMILPKKSSKADKIHELDPQSAVMTLPDGRKLCYSEFGARRGKPILLNHGMACSRLDGLYFHEAGLQFNARIIGIDRPGMGRSSPHPGRTVLSFAKDVEHLTDHLHLDQYTVMGVSGGGPCTLACARALPDTKLKGVAMVVALGPPDIGMHGARFMNRIGYPYGFLFCPSFVNRWFWRREAIGRVDLSDDERLAILQRQIEQSKGEMSEKERITMENAEGLRIGLKSTREGFLQGYDGVLLDGRLCCRDLGFKVEDLRAGLPIHLWYAEQDVLVPANHGVQLAKRLGKRASLRLKDETHVSLTFNWKNEIIADLVSLME